MGTGTIDEDVTAVSLKATVSALGTKLSDCSGDGKSDMVCHLPGCAHRCQDQCGCLIEHLSLDFQDYFLTENHFFFALSLDAAGSTLMLCVFAPSHQWILFSVKIVKRFLGLLHLNSWC